MSPKKVRSYSYTVSPTQLSTQELKKDKANKHANVCMGKAQEASTLHEELQVAAEIVFSSDEMSICYPIPMASPENIHTSKIIKTEQVVLMYL